jgi:hypothetical protein
LGGEGDRLNRAMNCRKGKRNKKPFELFDLHEHQS